MLSCVRERCLRAVVELRRRLSFLRATRTKRNIRNVYSDAVLVWCSAAIEIVMRRSKMLCGDHNCFASTHNMLCVDAS